MKEAVNRGDLSQRNSGALQWFDCEALGATDHGQPIGDHDSRRTIASLGYAGVVF